MTHDAVTHDAVTYDPATPPGGIPERSGRVLVLMTNREDANRTADTLAAAGIEGFACADAPHLCRELECGAGALLLTEEAIHADRQRCIPAALGGQPAWSSVPLVAVVREGATAAPRDSVLSEFAANVTLIERPVRIRTLLSVVRAALKARRHQYEIRDAIAAQENQAEALRRNHETFFNLVQNAPFGVYVVDADFRLRQVSAGSQNVFRTVRPLLGRDFAEVLRTIWAEPFASEAVALFRHTLETGEPYRAPNTTERRGDLDAVESYDWQIERVTLPDGRFGVVCYFYDLTERNRVEEERRAAERRLQLVTDHAPVLLAHCDRQSRFKFVNLPYAARFGMRAEDVVGKTVPEIIGTAAYAAIEPYVRQVLAGARVTFEVEVPYERGEPRWMRCGYEPEFDAGGGVIGFVAAISDVTERKRAEHRAHFLLRLDDMLRPLTDPHEITQASARLLGEFLAVDRCAYADVEADEDTFNLTGDYCRGVPSIVGRYTFTQFGKEVLRLMRADEPYVVVDIDHHVPPPEDLAAYRQTRIQAVICVPLHKAGKFVAAMAVHQAAPRLWREEEVELVRAVASRSWESIERARALRELREADRRKDQFLATLAHELRNPLAPISNALEAWPLVADDRAESDEMRELMGRQVRQMTRLIDDLLDVSRISRGKIELRRERVDLAEAVEAAVESVRPFVDACGHELSVATPREPIAVDGDLGRLVQVFGNLVHNAAKYTGRDGHITVTVRREGPSAVVSVRDDGPGVPPEMLGRIFEMFTQVDQTLDRAHGGLGIGLTLVKTLVELHGGTVEAFSEGPGRGSEFVVRLPALADAAVPTAERPRETFRGFPPLPRRRVLVVDDVRPSARTLAMMLTGLGQEARSEHDGPAALQAAAAFRPEVVFLDIAMPGMDGYEVARRLRRESNGLQAVLVALTGYGQDEDRRRAFDAGFDHHLVKPTSVDALYRLLATMPAMTGAGR